MKTTPLSLAAFLVAVVAGSAGALGTGNISGVVLEHTTSIENIRVDILDATSASTVATTFTSSHGLYDSGPIPTGTYRIRFSDPGGHEPGFYRPEFFGAEDLDLFCSGTEVVVLTDMTSDADADLKLSSPTLVITNPLQLRGEVVDVFDGRALENILVTVRHADNSTKVIEGMTDSAGQYHIGADLVGFGTVRVEFSDPAGLYFPQYFDKRGRDFCKADVVLWDFDGSVSVELVPSVELAVATVTSNLPFSNPVQPLQVNATIANSGGADSPPVDVVIFLDLNSNFALEGEEPFESVTITNIPPGGSRNVMGVFANAPGGAYQAVVVVDPEDMVPEIEENNNDGATPIEIARADLVVSDTASSSALTPSCAGGGGPNCPQYDVSLEATIENIGTLAVSTAQAAFAFSSDGGVSFWPIGGRVNAGAIAAGGSTTVQQTWRGVTLGEYIVRVVVDPGDIVAEGDETNNIATYEVIVDGTSARRPAALQAEIPGEDGAFGRSERVSTVSGAHPMIRYVVPSAGAIARVTIYDVHGRQVATLVDGWHDGGRHSVRWDGRDAGGGNLGSGMYFCRVEGEGLREVAKILLIR